MTERDHEPAGPQRSEIGGMARLAVNEMPYGPPGSAHAAIINSAGMLHCHPDPTYTALVTTLARHLGVPHATVMVGAGSSSILQLVVRLTCTSSKDGVVFAEPSPAGYSLFAAQANARQHRVPLRADGTVDADRVVAAITPSVRLVILANPHNPTGTALPTTQLNDIVVRIPDRVLVVLDEAYHEFADTAVPDGVELAKARWAQGHHNITVLRTFSKAYGLAALRVGYGIAPPHVTTKVWAAGPRGNRGRRRGRGRRRTCR
jgi:histidinol-phosphate aminotransferase